MRRQNIYLNNLLSGDGPTVLHVDGYCEGVRRGESRLGQAKVGVGECGITLAITERPQGYGGVKDILRKGCHRY